MRDWIDLYGTMVVLVVLLFAALYVLNVTYADAAEYMRAQMVRWL